MADKEDADVVIWRKGGTVYAETRTGAPAALLDALDAAGLQRRTQAVYTWHEVPQNLTKEQERQLASRATAMAADAGYYVQISPELFDLGVHDQAVTELVTTRRNTESPAGPGTTPATPAPSTPPRRTGPRR
ncbi:hypothetical protein [Streptomyces sp. YIM 98790]|uniref:hypothetical protein n=1 Tax=Streptomyces sp. YIM 98790 TaxID=2689077 RepID=UPI0014079592|nr:hypothetical protein [Streptomyces sp. YIM 98790]